MKILLIDDEIDILDLLQIVISSEFPNVVVITARDGEDGLKIVKEHSDLKLVFCDYTMPNMNGGMLFSEIRKVRPKLHFVLLSSVNPENHNEFINAKLFHHIDKPFNEKVITNKIMQIMFGSADNSKSLDYVAIEIEILYRMGKIHCALYLKISSDKFVKVMHASSDFNDAEFKRFKNKQVEELYIERFEFENFIKDFKKNVFSKMAWERARVQDKIEVLSNDMSLIQKASKIFGWSPQVIQLAQENISTVINIIKTEKSLESLNELLKNKRNQKLTSHSMILAIMFTDIIKRLGWEANRTIEKMTFAALLHDLTLDEDLFADKLTLIMANDFSTLKTTPEANSIFNHPVSAAQLTLNWSFCPPDVDVIIRQHHERPDGQGFPMELPAFRIFPLSALFIMCEDLVYNQFIEPDSDLKTYFTTKKEYYSREPFKGIYLKIMEMLTSVSAT